MWLYNFGLTCYVWIIRLVARDIRRHGSGINAAKTSTNGWPRPRTLQPVSSGYMWLRSANSNRDAHHRTHPQGTSRIQNPAHVLLAFATNCKNYQAWITSSTCRSTRRAARRFLDAAHPEIAVFVKYEFWLNLLYELRRRKVRLHRSAIFRRNSIFRPYGGMWRQALESFDVMFVQNEESKTLLAGLGFDNVIVAGDTRFVCKMKSPKPPNIST